MESRLVMCPVAEHFPPMPSELVSDGIRGNGHGSISTLQGRHSATIAWPKSVEPDLSPASAIALHLVVDRTIISLDNPKLLQDSLTSQLFRMFLKR